MRYQKTIGRAVTCEGIGLHSGEPAAMRFIPAPVDTGIIFTGIKAGRRESIRAQASNLISTNFSTTLGKNGVTIRTVEHVLAAIAGLGIDNLYIEVEGPEIPILDGSAWLFVQLLEKAGIIRQGKAQPYIKIEKPIRVADGARFIEVNPSDQFAIHYTMSFQHSVYSDQKFFYRNDERCFVEEIAKARTYGFLKDLERLRSAGLIKGGSLQNAVVIGEQSVLNEEGLRYPDEMVRHKILDLMGDMVLLGRPLLGELTVHLAGHALHTQLVSAILESPEAWVVLEDAPEPASPSLSGEWAFVSRAS